MKRRRAVRLSEMERQAMTIRIKLVGLEPFAFRRWLAAVPVVVAWSIGQATAEEVGEVLSVCK